VAEQVGDAMRADAPRPPMREAIDVERFPNVAAVGEMKPVDYDLEFELGLDFIVAGIERLLASESAGTGGGYEKSIG
jgi:hypothetical protein